MKCLRNGKYPCGKCAACLHNKVEDWKLRLSAEAEDSYSFFLTLTYDNDHLPHEGVRKSHLQSYFKMLRSRGFTFKYYAISEYGPTTHRPHYHILLFFPQHMDYDQLYDALCSTWNKGNICLYETNANRIQYVSNYHVTKGFSPANKAVNFKISSQGLGVSYLTQNRVDYIRQKSNGTTNKLGYRMRIPRYYREQLFLTDDEKERIQPPKIEDSIKIPSEYRKNSFSRDHLDALDFIHSEKKRLEWWNKKVLSKIFHKKNKI